MPEKEPYRLCLDGGSLPVGVVLLDCQCRVQTVNQRARELCGHGEAAGTEEQFQNQLSLIFAPDKLPFSAAAKSGLPVYGLEREIEKPDGTSAILCINCAPLKDSGGDFAGAAATLDDNTDQKLNEEDREKLIEELTAQSRQLEEFNDTLKVLLNQRDRDKAGIEENMTTNLKSLVLPYLERLRLSLLNAEQRAHLEAALANLVELSSSFGASLRSPLYGLTPRELEVADLVKHGKSNKEAAAILCISVRSVESHRRAIRRKLGLQNQKVNLRAFLLSLQ